MSATRSRIENLVLKIQDDFLRTPWLALTLPAARRRFAVDEITCEGVLDALADAQVLSKSRQGIYVRNFPEPTARRARVRRGTSLHAA